MRLPLLIYYLLPVLACTNKGSSQSAESKTCCFKSVNTDGAGTEDGYHDGYQITDALMSQQNIHFRHICGEEVAAGMAGAKHWIEIQLLELLSGDKTKNVCSADESALYYNPLSDGTLA